MDNLSAYTRYPSRFVVSRFVVPTKVTTSPSVSICHSGSGSASGYSGPQTDAAQPDRRESSASRAKHVVVRVIANEKVEEDGVGLERRGSISGRDCRAPARA
jgi:hypothetical protein